jgi:iron-sulfur cluster repair protein YtfE (RIC family)
MLIHVQKEEAALLPLIEDTMGEEAEMRLYDVYTGNR